MSEYSGKQIKILKGLEAVRKRPGMYIGDKGEGGLHHLVYEAIDNSIDEAKAGHGTVINLTVSEENRITVQDFGRGIPVDYNEEEKKSSLEIVFTVLHAGGKFDDSAYKISGGLHGVGASVINALSSEMQVEVIREKKKYFQEYRKGIPVKDVEETGKGTKSGTKISFIPDTEIFERGIDFKKEILLTRMKEICYLNSFLTINFKFKNDELIEINYPNGLVDFMDTLSPKDNIFTSPFMLSEEYLDIALTYKEKEYDVTLKSYINIISTTEGGSHLNGALRAITAVMQDKCKAMKITGVKREHIIEGLVLIVSTYYPEPNFEGQTKRKLDEPAVEKRIYTSLKNKFHKFIEENPKTTKKLIDKILLAKKVKEAEKRIKETVRKKELNKEVGTLPGKLTDCRSRDPEISELYLVEGDSAGGCIFPAQRVLLADGRSLEIEKLAKEFDLGKENFVYTFNQKTKKIELQKIKNCWETKKVKNLIKITLDNGKTITSTIDHRFMLKDGKYLEANKLETGMSLKPIYLSKSKKGENGQILNDYFYVNQEDGTIDYTHFLADKYNEKYNSVESFSGERYVRHHIDFNKQNNNPSNLIRMDWYDHRQLHNDNCHITLHTPEVRAKIKKSMATKESKEKRGKIVSDLWKDENYRKKYKKDHHKKMRQSQIDKGINLGFGDYWEKKENRNAQSERVIKNFKDNPNRKKEMSKVSKKQWENKKLKKWRSKKTKEQMSDPENVKKKLFTESKTRIKNSLELLNKVGIDLYEKNRTKKEYLIKTLIKKINYVEGFLKLNSEEDLIQSELYVYNHKIEKIEYITYDDPIGVYDIEVPETHNFALEAGVFVHNSAKQGRNKETQAILPLKGKIPNVFKKKADIIKTNNEISGIIKAIGTGSGKDFDISKIRYHKIITMTDADVDGSHIATLLLFLGFQELKPLIEGGYFYISIPPLYRAKKGDIVHYFADKQERNVFFRKDYTLKKGKTIVKLSNYIDEFFEKQEEKDWNIKKVRTKFKINKENDEEILLSKEELDIFFDENKKEDWTVTFTQKNDRDKWNVTRFKGLGEMNPEQLEETAMDPKKRRLVKVTMNNVEEAEKVLMALGGKDTEFRQKYLMRNVK